MKHGVEIGLGIGLATAVALMDEFLPGGGIVLLVVVAALALASLIAGRRLPLYLRVFATAIVIYLGYTACLIGRTMEPGLSRYTLAAALGVFAVYAALPALTLLRIWSGRFRLTVVPAVFLVSLTAACAVAAFEEHLFVLSHPNGVGPTARWTVSSHWLAFNAENRRLDGSD